MLNLFVIKSGGVGRGDPVPGIEAWARSRGITIDLRFQGTTCAHTWVGDHATDPTRNFETQTLAGSTEWNPRGPVYIVGFSAGGYGALSLLARHPKMFAGALAFDAPFTIRSPRLIDSVDMLYTYGTTKNFRTNYRLTEPGRIEALRGKRLVIMGHCHFGKYVDAFHEILRANGIAHTFESEFRAHTWTSGWVERGLDLLTTT